MTDARELRTAVFAGISSPPMSEPAETRASAAQGKSSQSLLLSENVRSIGGPPGLLDGLTYSERETVLKQARRRVFYRGQTLFNQDTPHEGIYLIESGRIRVFYNAPSGREITLAYWYPGNFVGGPDIFGSITSRMTRSGFSSRALVRAVEPSETLETRKPPSLRKFRLRRSTTSFSSSTIRIRFLDTASMRARVYEKHYFGSPATVAFTPAFSFKI